MEAGSALTIRNGGARLATASQPGRQRIYQSGGYLFAPDGKGGFVNIGRSIKPDNPMELNTYGQDIPDTPKWANTMMSAGEGLVSAITAPGAALSGRYDRVVDPNTGENYYPGMAEDASGLAGLVTLGAGAIPAEAGALNMGMRVHHGSPNAAIDTLRSSERGPLGPAVYATPMEPLAKRYAGESGKVYSFDAPDEIFHGMKPWLSGSDVNPYQIWRDQADAVLKVAPDDKRDAIKSLFEKMSPDDGYPFYQRLVNILGSHDAAQGLLKKAGYKGMTGFVDGPEMALFDRVPLTQAQ